MRIPPRPPQGMGRPGSMEQQPSPLLKISTGIHVSIEPRKTDTFSFTSQRHDGIGAQTRGIVDAMEAAAESRFDSDFSAARIIELVEDAITASPETALETQSQTLTTSKLRLVK